MIAFLIWQKKIKNVLLLSVFQINIKSYNHILDNLLCLFSKNGSTTKLSAPEHK